MEGGAEGASVGETEGLDVIRGFVGATVGRSVGLSVGVSVGSFVGDSVGALVGDSVGSEVGLNVGTVAVGISSAGGDTADAAAVGDGVSSGFHGLGIIVAMFLSTSPLSSFPEVIPAVTTTTRAKNKTMSRHRMIIPLRVEVSLLQPSSIRSWTVN